MPHFERPTIQKEPEYPLYRDRVFLRVSEEAERIRESLQKSEEQPILTETERDQLLDLEDHLGSALEKIHEISPISTTFYPDYLLTEEGGREFSNLFGIPVEGESEEDVERFLLLNRDRLLQADGKLRLKFIGKTSAYQEKKLFSALITKMGDDGSLHIREDDPLPEASRLSILLEPEKTRVRTEYLRTFKSGLRKTRSDIANGPGLGTSMNQALLGLTDIYARRVNEMLTESYTAAASLKRKANLLGEDALSEDEKVIFRSSPVTNDPEEAASRMDKMLHGAESGYDREGWRRQIGPDLERFADKAEEEIIQSALEEERAVSELGLDREKLDAKNFPKNATELIAKEILDHYGFLSDFGADTYDPNHPEIAPDGKWRVFLDKKYDPSGFSVNPKHKILFGPAKPLSVKEILPVLSHEIEGHVLQHENKERLPLRIFRRVGAGRWAAFAECSAMDNQDHVSREAFGIRFFPGPHYVRAMKTRLDGGSYIQCVAAHHESMMRVIRAKREAGLIHDQESFRKQSEAALKRSINRAKRLFSSELGLEDVSSSLLKSKDATYLEQRAILDAYRRNGLEKFLHIGSMNTDTLGYLVKYDLIDPNTVQLPDFHTLQIWERLRPEYLKND
ncbi:MAG: hypothetical protein HGA38_03215 [Candidatus Moranbacteria bacterium]|nr:hypothetical protein [Candidatus Moranbacteria bacterium]